MTRQEEPKPERDEFELEPETVVDLEPKDEDTDDVRGGGLGTRCTRGSLVQRL